jgi:hypothetical protein
MPNNDGFPLNFQMSDGPDPEDMSPGSLTVLVLMNFLLASLRDIAHRELGPDCTAEEVQGLMYRMVAKGSIQVLASRLLLSHDAIGDFFDATRPFINADSINKEIEDMRRRRDERDEET